MKKIVFIFCSLILFASCGSLSKNPYSVVGSWDFVDVDIDVVSSSPSTDRLIRTAFAAYTTLGGGMDQLRGTIKFDRNGYCKAPKFSCDYTFYGNTLSLKQKLLNAAGVNTSFMVEHRYDEMYLIYDAKEAIASFGVGLANTDIQSVERANIILVFRRK